MTSSPTPPIDIRAIRRGLNLTQEQFAPLVGATSKQHLGQWERGETPPSTAARLLLALIGRRPDVIDDLRAIAALDPAPAH